MRSCPSHADRFARAVVPILRNLSPLSEEETEDRGRKPGDSDSDSGGGGDGEYDGDGDGDDRALSMAQASLGAAAAAVVTAERKAAATETLLALRRPLEAFLRTGMLFSVPGSSSPPSGCSSLSPGATTNRKRRRFGRDKTGRSVDGHDGGGGVVRENGRHGGGESCSRRRFSGRDGEEEGLGGGGRGGRAGAGAGGAVVSPAAAKKFHETGSVKTSNGAATGTETPTVAAAYLELEEVLLPRCIVPLFEAAAGTKKTTGAEGDRQRQRERESGGGRGKGEGVGGGSARKERKKGLLKCLEAVLEVSTRRGRGGRGSVTGAGAALDALRT